MATPDYVLGSDDAEIERLQGQAAIIAEPTDVLFRRGGLRAGMRVLDLGSGPGDVSFLVAGIVGEDGSVLGLEQDPAQLAVAERRREQLGLHNVSFAHGDARTFVGDAPFDAVVCRLLLMHLPDAVDVLAHHRRNLRPDGVFVAVDYDMTGARSLPEVDLFTRVGTWIRAGFEHARADATVGMRFPILFEQAGYADVGTLGLQVYFPPQARQAAGYVVGVVRALEDAIVASGVVSAAELDIATLDARLAAAVEEAGAVWTMPTIVGGWGRHA
ncbi:class I SAM-dependent methyltransferase [Mycolicibacterium sp. 018/SC-01/001]|uniref:class I SAM-dependent methyltransferase n=1 Tax=Mycolicibacterium sp. 018/SC-01/001 TaxID=2592069 RepID=UPI00117F46E2|nr:class I SAM-dependent methyltransferase [Mycolicibacterium sp. 018/SC-01/001]TRW84927.1 class I SAM-dependent methyltransferase [Mycolicibacterium sp. 018/SC-01/001]